MSETPSLEPNASAGEPAAQPAPILPGDDGPQDAATAAQAAAAPAAEVETERALIMQEGAYLLHDEAPTPPETIDAPALDAAAGPPPTARARVRIDHVPSVGHCYPGEPVVLYTRVRVLEETPGLQLTVAVPHWLRVEEVDAPPEAGVYALDVGAAEDHLRWDFGGLLPAGSQLEIATTVVVPPIDHLVFALPSREDGEHEIVSTATVMPVRAQGAEPQSPTAQTAVVALRRKGSYLKYLPAVYERDSFMGRFLMLFESFWGPIDGQVETLADYFDPMLTTLPMLKWLAERLDLQVDDELPVAVVRKLVAKAVPLYRKRGTRAGLQELLQIYTGGEVRIVERRATNMLLGAGARLGQGIALGIRNQPHTFTLYIKLPPLPDSAGAPAVAERQRERRRARIRSLIELEKPAHVTYTLDVDED